MTDQQETADQQATTDLEELTRQLARVIRHKCEDLVNNHDAMLETASLDPHHLATGVFAEVVIAQRIIDAAMAEEERTSQSVSFAVTEENVTALKSVLGLARVGNAMVGNNYDKTIAEMTTLVDAATRELPKKP